MPTPTQDSTETEQRCADCREQAAWHDLAAWRAERLDLPERHDTEASLAAMWAEVDALHGDDTRRPAS